MPKLKRFSHAWWLRIRADYAKGVALSTICKEHNIELPDLVAKIKEQKWTRKRKIKDALKKAQGKKKKANKKKDIKPKKQDKPETQKKIDNQVSEENQEDTEGQLPSTLVLSEIDEKTSIESEETIDSVNIEHLEMFRNLRQSLAEQIHEYKVASSLMAKFAGTELAELIYQVSVGEDEHAARLLAEYQERALGAWSARSKMLQQLTGTAINIVSQEREIIGLTNESEGSGAFEDLMDEIEAAKEPPPLPENVINYDAKLKKARAQGKLG